MRFADRVVVITGGSKGIGAEPVCLQTPADGSQLRGAREQLSIGERSIAGVVGGRAFHLRPAYLRSGNPYQ